MDSLIAPINNIKFDIEVALEQQLGAQPLPFPGMDSKFSLYKPNIRQCISFVFTKNQTHQFYLLFQFIKISLFNFFSFQNPQLWSAHSLRKANVNEEIFVHIDIWELTGPLFVNIGFVVCVRREINVNFFTNLIWQKCQSAIFMHDSVRIKYNKNL